MKHKMGALVSPLGRGVILGTAVCFGITLIGSSVCAAMISSETIAAGSTGYGALMILLLASFCGATAGAGKAREKRLYKCMLIALIYMLLLLAMTALFFDGQYKGVPITALVVFTGGIVAAILGINRGKRSNLRKSKIKHR